VLDSRNSFVSALCQQGQWSLKIRFKFKTGGDRYFCAAGLRSWSSRPHSQRAGAVVCTDATPATVSSLFHCLLLDTYSDGLSPNFSWLSATSVDELDEKAIARGALSSL